MIPPRQDALLRVQDLSVSYQGRGETVAAVRSATFEVHAGECVALVGESGSGKSTIARAVMAMLSPAAGIDNGSIRYDGRELVGLDEKSYASIRGRLIGWVPQDPMVSLNPLHKIGKQVAEPLRIHGLATGADADEKAIALLDRVGISNPRMRIHNYPHELSGGMRQRVLIAAALSTDPRLIIADEPTTALDATVQKRILDDIEALTTSAGIAVLLITHDLAVAADRAQRIIVLRHGEIVETGTTEQVLSRPQHPYTKALLAAAPSLSSARRSRGPSRSDDPVAAVATPPKIVVESVSMSFTTRGGRGTAFTHKAVDNVSIQLVGGQTLGVVGESGSGKTTLARIVLGLAEPSGGQVRFEGENIAQFDRGARRRYRQVVQPVYQNPYASLNPRLSVAAIIREPLEGFGLGNRQQRSARIDELLDQVKLPRAMAERRTWELSGGQRQRVAIARALAPRPQVLVLDEPVSALDVSVQAQILDLLAELQQEHGLTYMFISHDLAVVRQVADWVAVMKDGQIVESGSVETIFDRPVHDYTRLLLASIPGSRKEAA